MLGDFLLKNYNSFKNPWYHKLAMRIISVNYGNCNLFQWSQGIRPRVRIDQIVPRTCRHVLHYKFCSTEQRGSDPTELNWLYNLQSPQWSCCPTLPKDKSFVEIKTILQKHFEPKRAVIAEWFYFHKRDQSAGESVTEYDAALSGLLDERYSVWFVAPRGN